MSYSRYYEKRPKISFRIYYVVGGNHKTKTKLHYPNIVESKVRDQTKFGRQRKGGVRGTGRMIPYLHICILKQSD